MFSTHPPIKARVAVLLEMAHLDEASLEEKLKGFIRVSPVAVPVSPIQENAGTKRWNIFNEGQWSGLYSLDELRSAMTLLPAQWVRPEGGVSVVQASDDPDLKILFGQGAVKIPELSCPNCKVGLSEYIYEGSVVLRCAYCGGAFVDSDRVSRILIRQDYQPSKEVERLAKIAAEAKDRGRLYMRKLEHDKEWVIDCPKCKRKMHRQFFVYSYPVEIDRCPNCFGTWFDKFELEILQYVYEHYEDILYNDKSF